MPETTLVPSWLGFGFAFAFGAIVGSFANVCIHRLPRGESIVFPPSRCPGCGTRVAPWDNVPVLSWFLLRGRCRSCREPISPRYPLVEALGGAILVVALATWGATGEAAAFSLLALSALVLVPTDLEHRILPDEVTLGAAGLGIALALARDLAGAEPGFGHFFASALGAALGAAILLLVRAGYRRLRGVEGMGLGDVKMLAMIGAVTGPAGVLVTLFLSSLCGAAAGGLLVAFRAVSWRAAIARPAPAGSGPGDPAPLAGGGALVSAEGTILATGRRWREIPGAPAAGESALAGAGGRTEAQCARPLAAFVRLARRRAKGGQETSVSRLVLDDGGEFFRVLAARAVPRDGGLLVLLSRSDIPFGVFLSLGSLAAFVLGRALLARLLGAPDPAGALLLGARAIPLLVAAASGKPAG